MFKKKLILSFLFFFFAAAPLFWAPRVVQYNLLGFADFVSPTNLDTSFYARLFTYEASQYGGIDFSFLIAQIVPFYLFFLLFHALHISPALTTLFVLFFILLISEVSMFFYLKYLLVEKLALKKSLSNIFLCFFGGVFYALSPYVIALIEPGHFQQLLLYATLPTILLNTDKLISRSDFKIKEFIFLFFLFLFNSTAFANIGIIYVLVIILGLYSIVFCLATRVLFRTISKLFLIYMSIFLANIWWLFPFVINLKDTISLNEASSVINDSLGIAIYHASVANLFLGRGDSLFYLTNGGLPNTFYLSPVMFVIFVFFLLCMFYAIINSKKIIAFWQLLFLAIGGIFISKGFNEPFGNLFMFFYNHFPGFQIFRRPVSKFYWVFIFALIALVTVGIALFLKKNKQISTKIIVYLILTLSAFYLWTIFVLTPLLVPFTVPTYYYSAQTYLKEQHVNKLLIAPGFFGTYPTYNATFNNFYGTDFLAFIWNFSQLVPDKTTYSPNLPYKKQLSIMMDQIRKGRSFCNQARDLGITHIMVRQDIDLTSPMENKPYDLITLLEKSSEISSARRFGTNDKNGFMIYQIIDTCTQNNIVIGNNSEAKVEFTMANPVKYQVKLSYITEGETVELLNNFNAAWTIYLDKKPPATYQNENYYHPHTIFIDFSDLRLLFDKPYNKELHSMTRGYANGWKLQITELQKLGTIQKNSDGTYSVNLVIYYNHQFYFYIGTIIFLLVLLSLCSYMVYSSLRKRKVI